MGLRAFIEPLIHPLILEPRPQGIGYQARREGALAPVHTVNAHKLDGRYFLVETVEDRKWGIIPTGKPVTRSIGTAETEAEAQAKMRDRLRARAEGYSPIPVLFFVDNTENNYSSR